MFCSSVIYNTSLDVLGLSQFLDGDSLQLLVPTALLLLGAMFLLLATLVFVLENFHFLVSVYFDNPAPLIHICIIFLRFLHETFHCLNCVFYTTIALRMSGRRCNSLKLPALTELMILLGHELRTIVQHTHTWNSVPRELRLHLPNHRFRLDIL